MAIKGKVFTVAEAKRTHNVVKRIERDPRYGGKPIPTRTRFPPVGVCTSQNCIIQVTTTGSPTSGTFDQDWLVDGTTTTLTFGYNNNAAAYAAILDNHSKIASGDITVTGGDLPDATIQIEFKSSLANTDIAIPVSDWNSLDGGSGMSVITSKTQLGVS